MSLPRPPMAAAMLTAMLVATACSSSDTSSASTPKPSATPSPSASSSAFCLDLTTFQVGVVIYRGGVVDAVRGKPLDFKEFRRKAALILRMGDAMESTTPPEIAEQFRTVLKAIKKSSGKLKEGATVGDIVNPLYGKNNAAFDAVGKYKCKAGQ